MLPAKVAKQLRVKRTVATAKVTAGSTPAFVTMRFTKKARRALARVRKVQLTAVVAATASDGTRASVTNAATLRR
jgi:hypothetical protein